jgi:hypothetical protein
MKNVLRVLNVAFLAAILLAVLLVNSNIQKLISGCNGSNSVKTVDVASYTHSKRTYDISDSLGNKAHVVELLINCDVVESDTNWYCKSELVIEKTKTKKQHRNGNPQVNNKKDPPLGSFGPDKGKDTIITKVDTIVKTVFIFKKDTHVINNNQQINNFFGQTKEEPKIEPAVIKKRNVFWPAVIAGLGGVVYGLNQRGIFVKGFHGDLNYPDQAPKLEIDKKFVSKDLNTLSYCMIGGGAIVTGFNLWLNHKNNKKEGRIKPIVSENGPGMAIGLN